MNEYEKWVELPEDPMTWPEPTIEPSPEPTLPELDPTIEPSPEPTLPEPELYPTEYMGEYQDDMYSEQRSGRVR